MTKTIIIENEPAPANHLTALLNENFPDIEILEVCKTVETSLNAIKKYSPDLVFMDVELNNRENGFEVLENLDKVNFEIIVTTSFDKYAKQACQASSLDFLEKPVSAEALIAAVEKYKKRKTGNIDPRQIELFLSICQNSNLSLKTFALPTMTGLDFVETDNIIYCEAASNQVIVHLLGNKKILVTRTLKACEELLSHSNFYRIHKSFLINLNHIKKYNRGKVGTVTMRDIEEPLPVSPANKVDFLRRF